ncbi:hypothetical protein K501DRAFT_274608 [Backusella circina FSU 941]|nr:hypothetical protein K501DRAFT_274608 [Backusella circina FSU 941]
MAAIEILPNEILTEIFLLLHQKDKVECMLVCQHWEQLVAASCLFQTVCIYCMDGLEKITTKMEGDPKQGLKVRRLVIDFLTEDDADLNSLLPLLPNLRAFLFMGPEADQEIDEKLIYPWHKKITNITECAIKTVTHQLLSHTICPNLTTLSITDNFYDIIPILGNAPGLEHLDICFGDLLFADLNSIHNKLPRLKSLDISLISLGGTDFTPYIEPAPMMRECCISNVKMPTDTDGTEIKLLRFIRLKYLKLSKLEYQFNARTESGITRCSDRLNQFGWLPLFRELALTLKDIHIDGGSEPLGLFKMLDGSNCKINRLQIGSLKTQKNFLELAESKQVQYIKSLELTNMTTVNCKWLKHLSVLEELWLGWDFGIEKTVNLNSILNNYTFSIEALSFRCVVFPDNLDQFITKYLPRLHTLKLLKCNLESRVLDLSPLDMRLFEIETNYPCEGKGIVVITQKDDEEQWYPLDEERSYLTFYK